MANGTGGDARRCSPRFLPANAGRATKTAEDLTAAVLSDIMEAPVRYLRRRVDLDTKIVADSTIQIQNIEVLQDPVSIGSPEVLHEGEAQSPSNSKECDDPAENVGEHKKTADERIENGDTAIVDSDVDEEDGRKDDQDDEEVADVDEEDGRKDDQDDEEDADVDEEERGKDGQDDEDDLEFEANVDADVEEGSLDEDYFSEKELGSPLAGRPYTLPTKRGEVVFEHAEHQERFEKLKNRPFKPSRMCCEDALDRLGIHSEVTELLSVLDWEKFAFLPNICYKEMTLEFLSSFHLLIDGDDQYPPYTLTFQLLNRRFVMRYEKFAKIFGFSYDGLDSAGGDYNKNEFWSKIGGKGLFRAGRSKGSEIKNKAVRYIHRFMSYSVECRGESNSVLNKNELFFLWCMLNGCKLQTGKYFLRHLQDMAYRPRGTIMIGAFVTHIALELKLYDPAKYEPPAKVDSTDQNLTLSSLERMEMIKKVRGGYVFVDEAAIIADRPRKRKKTDDSDDNIESEATETIMNTVLSLETRVKALGGAVAGVDGRITAGLRELENVVAAVRQEIGVLCHNVAEIHKSLRSD